MSQLVRLQVLRAADTAERTSYTPHVGEFIYQLDTQRLYIGDGSTAGGILIAVPGGSGEVNTASNVGVGGVGVFKQKSGLDLEFKNINAGSSKVSITNDAANNEIDIDIIPGQINTADLNNTANFQTNAQVSAAIAAHEAAVDPHPTYTTAAEAAAAAPVQSVNGETGTLTNYAKRNTVNTFTESQNILKTSGQAVLDIDADASSAGINLRAGANLWGIYGSNGANELYIGTNNGPGIGEQFIISTTEVDAKTKKIVNVVNPTSAQDAATIDYVDNALPVFGTQFQTEESLAESVTTSTTFQTKIVLTTPVIPAGTYRIGFYYNWSYNSTANDFEARLLEDGSTTIMVHEQEPQDSGVDQQLPNSGFIYRTLTSASHSYTLQWRTDLGGINAYIRNARLEFWRVS